MGGKYSHTQLCVYTGAITGKIIWQYQLMCTAYDTVILFLCSRVTFAYMHKENVYYSTVCNSNNCKQLIYYQ